MPAPGTKKIEIDGQVYYLPADNVALDQLIADGVTAQRDYEDAKGRLEVIREKVIALAEEHKGPTATVHLQAPKSGLATVTFSTATKVDDTAVAAMEPEVPKVVFDKIFEASRSFKLRRGAQQWLKIPQAADLERVKARVAATIRVVPKGTTVKFFGPGEKSE